jgi:hypothetical protein
MPTPSILLIPDRYKAAVLYSQIPDSGAVDFDVTRSTTAYRTNASGILESVASGVPRLDYPAAGGCPSLLVEPAATNLVLRSEEFDNAAWTLSRTSAFGSGSVANAVTSPDGYTNAEYIQQASGETDSGGCFQSISYTSGTTYTLSVFAKQGENRYARIGFGIGTAGSAIFCGFDLQEGIAGTPAIGISSVSIVDYGSGWYRCSITAISQVTLSRGTFVYQSSNLNSTTTTPLQGIYLWGAQLETGSVATSYIPTVAATATRNADVISKTGVSGFIGQTEGAVAITVNLTSLSGLATRFLFNFIIDDNNRLGFRFLSTTSCEVAVRTGGTNFGTSFSFPAISTGLNNIIIQYTTTDIKAIINGIVYTSTSARTYPSLNNIVLGAYSATSLQFNDRIRAAAIYTTRLEDDELIALTTL